MFEDATIIGVMLLSSFSLIFLHTSIMFSSMVSSLIIIRDGIFFNATSKFCVFTLRKINSFKTDVILSTGMATMNEISEAVRELENCRVRLLHCTTEYPCPYCDVNMAAMLSMKEKFNLEVGYSDHTEGIEIPIMAAALGATIIEKHFTLDKRMKGPDHKASLSPRELADMVRAVRNVELAFGTGYKAPLDSETNNRIAARKSIVVKRPIKKGDLFSEENLTAKRPGNGISPMKWDSIIGSMALRDYEIDEMI